ncbi:MAG: hypothetical protein IJ228_06320 [Succinivibrio sp.]|nr:hypothetical protein [Succinivibrio sp.]
MCSTLDAFRNIANSTSFSSRDVLIDGSDQNTKVKLGNLIFSSGKKANDATMAAFREALSKSYGVFGEHAFDTVVGSRQALHKSLRACDIQKTLSSLGTVRRLHYRNELRRQFNTDPTICSLSRDMFDKLKETVFKSKFDITSLKGCRSQTDLARLASQHIHDAIKHITASVEGGIDPEYKNLDLTQHDIGGNGAEDKTFKSFEPTGLKNLKVILNAGSTSVGDQIKSGKLGVGMLINRSVSNPLLLDGLKKNDVEPGFIYKNDWSTQDSSSLMTDYESEESLQKLEELKTQHPKLALECLGKSVRDQIMLFGRAHPACMSAVADFILEHELQKPGSALYQAFSDKHPEIKPEEWRDHLTADMLKKDLFVELRDTVMSVGKKSPYYSASPVFKHFSDRHIVKLDYNENERIFKTGAASAGKFMRPERVLATRKPILGHIYRLGTASSADKRSVGAVSEAFANDLTRLAGIPAQELTIVRGQFSDGHPKIMLEAKFADGYKDMERGYLKDGQIVPPKDKKGRPVQLESLGKYKVFFMTTADRDGVGRRGQNKGFAHGRFFAIDPGHSLEGNGRFLEISDNFTFKDTYGSPESRFRNFSVFDDDTRFAKFQGALELRSLKDSGKVEQLYESYLNAFDPNAPDISAAEKKLRTAITAELKEKFNEFKDSQAKILNVAAGQLALYDALSADGPEVQEQAIETIENLEKLTSPTTWLSPKGEVALKHLAVKPESRIPWRAQVEGNNLVYHCDTPLPAAAQNNLRALAASAGVEVKIDAEGCATLIIPKGEGATKAFAVFSEQNVAKLTHPEEAAARATGGDGIAEGKLFAKTQNTAAVPQGNAPAPFDLPEVLTVRVGQDEIPLRKAQIAPMLEGIPQSQRPAGIEELKAILASRIQRGRDIIAAALNGQGHRYEASLRNVACVTLAMHAATLHKGEYNERGSFSVEDPQGLLYQWLDGCKEIYLRTSTHARPYHDMQVDGHKNIARGIDIPEGGLGGLLGGMRTLHYFTLPEAPGLPRRLFLKCETYGIFHNTISSKDQEDGRAPGMQTRLSRSGDTAESVKHCLSLLTVITRMGNTEGNRKENIPESVRNSMRRAQNELKYAGFPALADTLVKGMTASSTGGIRMLLLNLVQVFEGAPENETVHNIGIALFNDLAEFAAQYGDSDLNRMSRMGKEVMLTAEEMTGA